MFALSRNRMPLSSLSWRRHRTTCETAVDTGARSLVSRKLTRTVKEADMSYVHERAKKLGLPIIEATEPVFIGVAADDIRKAKMKNSKCCAFSRAAQKEPGVRAAYFFRSIAFIEYPDRIVRYALPASARTELLSFDRSGVMAPGEYRLAPPAEIADDRERARLHKEEAQEAAGEDHRETITAGTRRCTNSAARRNRSRDRGAAHALASEVRAHDRGAVSHGPH